MQIPEPLRRFWREKVEPRPIAAGAAVAVAAGLGIGAYLAAGAGFERPKMEPVPVAARRAELPPQPIVFEKDANGRTPDWVIGTDNIPGRAPARQAVRTVPDEADMAAEDEARREGRGFGWLFAPWRWGRNAAPPPPAETAPPPRPSRRMQAYVEPPRERERDRYAQYADAYGDDAVAEEPPRYERRYAPPPRPEPQYDPRPDPRYDPRYAPNAGPRYDEPAYEPDEMDEPPPPERWRYGR